MTWEPVELGAKSKMAVPFDNAGGELTALPSTFIVNVPVGVVVDELEFEATVIVIASAAPTAGIVEAAERVVRDGCRVEVPDGVHALSKLLKSIEPRPEALS